MTATGWYPDPDGSPRFRYWDGDTWSTQTTTNPRTTPPPRTDDNQASGGHRNERGWVAALVVLALVTAVLATVLVWATGGVPALGGQAVEDTNSATPTVSAWDETSTPSYSQPPTDTGEETFYCPCQSQS